MTKISQGEFHPNFQSVVDVYERTLAEQPEGGSALAIYQNGERVVNVWGGNASVFSPSDWNEETASVMFSVTKGLLSILAHRLVQEGLLQLDRPVSYYWPEFAAEGKGEVPVSWLLQHRAGLSATRKDFELEDVLAGDPIDQALAEQEPLWVPGSGHAYHALTFGNLVGKVISIVTGRSLGQSFAELIANPLDAAAWIGLPASETYRVTKLSGDGGLGSLNPEVGSPVYWMEKTMTFGNAFRIGERGEQQGFNNPRVHAAELGGAGGIATADALAKIWSATVVETDGVRLLGHDAVAAAIQPASTGPSVWGEPGPYANRGDGFMVFSPGYREYLSPLGFGHDGLGGQTGFADPVSRVGFAYISNYLMSGEGEHNRALAVMAELKRTLASL